MVKRCYSTKCFMYTCVCGIDKDYITFPGVMPYHLMYYQCQLISTCVYFIIFYFQLLKLLDFFDFSIFAQQNNYFKSTVSVQILTVEFLQTEPELQSLIPQFNWCLSLLRDSWKLVYWEILTSVLHEIHETCHSVTFSVMSELIFWY